MKRLALLMICGLVLLSCSKPKPRNGKENRSSKAGGRAAGEGKIQG